MKRFLLSAALCFCLGAHAPTLGIIGLPKPATIPPGTYLVNQRFNNAGYDNGETWTPGGAGTVDPDDTTALEGNQSLHITAVANEAYTKSFNFSPQTEAWGYLMYKPVTISGSGTYCVVVNHATSQVMLTIAVDSTGALRVGANDEAQTATTTDVLSAGTLYHIFWHYKLGTGANGFASVSYSTDGTRPTSGTKYAEIANGSNTQDIDNIAVGSDNGVNRTVEARIDKVLISTTLVDSNPP